MTGETKRIDAAIPIRVFDSTHQGNKQVRIVNGSGYSLVIIDKNHKKRFGALNTDNNETRKSSPKLTRLNHPILLRLDAHSDGIV